MGEFAVSIKLSEAESVSDSGGFAPLTPDQLLVAFLLSDTDRVTTVTDFGEFEQKICYIELLV